MNLKLIANADPDMARTIAEELARQRTTLELIASENFTSPAVMAVQGSVLTNKYAEGYPDKRYYGGCEFVDIAEKLAVDRAKELFNSAYRQRSTAFGLPGQHGRLFCLSQAR